MAMRPGLLRYLSLQGATAEEAEDVLQDVGLKLSMGLQTAVEQPRAYLYRMTQNHFLLHRRSEGRRTAREKMWTEAHGGELPEVDETPSIETELVARQQLEILQAVIDRLPERTRFIFRRFRIDNVTQREIAGEIGISVSAVEKHLANAYAAVAAEKKRLDEGRGGLRSLFRGKRVRHDH